MRGRPKQMADRESQIVDGKGDVPHCPIIPAFHHSIVPSFQDPLTGAGGPIMPNKANLRRPRMRLTTFWEYGYGKPPELRRRENKANFAGLLAARGRGRLAKQNQFTAAPRNEGSLRQTKPIPRFGERASCWYAKQSQFAAAGRDEGSLRERKPILGFGRKGRGCCAKQSQFAGARLAVLLARPPAGLGHCG